MPPFAMLLREDLALGRLDVEAVEQTVKMVACACTHTHKPSTVSHQRAELTYRNGRYPDFRDEISGEEMGQAEDVMAIGLDPSFSDPLDHWRMSNNRLSHPRGDLVIDIPGVRGGFDDKGIRREQVSLGPSVPFFQGDAARIEHDLLTEVDAGNNEIMFVQIKGQVT